MQLVNSVAPFLLNSRLKPLLMRSPLRAPVHRQRVGRGGPVRAPQDRLPPAHQHGEGRAEHDDAHVRRRLRPGRHLHEQRGHRLGHGREPRRPSARATRTNAASSPPLDIVDGMARIYHPIAQGINERRRAAVRPVPQRLRPLPLVSSLITTRMLFSAIAMRVSKWGGSSARSTTEMSMCSKPAWRRRAISSTCEKPSQTSA